MTLADIVTTPNHPQVLAALTRPCGCNAPIGTFCTFLTPVARLVHFDRLADICGRAGCERAAGDGGRCGGHVKRRGVA